MKKLVLRKNERFKDLKEAIFCIAIGTAAGLVVYGIFLYLKIAIFGWNLGLIFAPLTAGYVETILANRIISEDIGAISAFVLFIYTTFYSFILKNPTLGINIITIGSMAVILQAAFPTVVNYILLVAVFGTISHILGVFKKITRSIYHEIKRNPKEKDIIEIKKLFSETESNKRINSLDFIFLTSTDLIHCDYELLGYFTSNVIIDIHKKIDEVDPQKIEKEKLKRIKEGKDECLIRLARAIKSDGGTGIIDLEIQYGLIGIGGDNVQINISGTGIKLNP